MAFSMVQKPECLLQNGPRWVRDGYIGAIMQRVRHKRPAVQPLRNQAVVSIKPRSVYEVFPPPVNYKPCAPPRVDPYNFAHVKPKACSQETSDASHYIQKRSEFMKQNEYHRYHNQWRCYYYGNAAEKEQYGAYLRNGLKQQMVDRITRKNMEEAKIKADEAKAVEQMCKKFDERLASATRKRKIFLAQFRDANRKLSEERQTARLQERQKELESERNMLKLNPINWSCTLK
ncbi:hypothetical protein CSKR_102255 [Clonorchis sinensis]|uniref:Uncharacterized protein n=2 Tax=Clonorchis sinensis TaxID=79923 RepID=G7YT45_CLOSI|nr:hypothetical protein CSKR_102255 [Clonorchis sinensis]GAA56125.1 hypothetical protein CLF_110026 [Clonorchis sinensis]